MSGNGFLERANFAFKSGNYDEAIKFYSEFVKNFPAHSNLVDINIRLSEDRLKNCLVGSSINIYPNFKYRCFDRVYVVSLREANKNQFKMAKQLEKIGIPFDFWPATWGYEGESLKKYKKYISRELGALVLNKDMQERERWRKKHFIESAGAVGYIDTYVKILKDAKRKRLKRVLILEDDIVLCKNFLKKLDSFLEAVPPDWLILQLGASQYEWANIDIKKSEKSGFYNPKRIDTCGSFGIAIDMEVADKIVNQAEYLESPFDLFPLGAVYEQFAERCFVSYPNIVMPDVRSSSIRGGRDQFHHSKKMLWNLHDFDFPIQTLSVNVVGSTSSLFEKNRKSLEILSRFCHLKIFASTTDGNRPLHDFFTCESDALAKIFQGATNTASNDYFLGEADVTIDLDESVFIESSVLESFSSYKVAIDALTSNHATKNSLAQVEKSGRCSVIIPTFKRGRGLLSSARSVLDQDYDDIELVIVNDNFPESSEWFFVGDVVEQLRGEYPHRAIKLVSHKNNRNGAAARNSGLMVSTGEFISFLDDDDLYLEGRISRCVKALQEQPKLVGGVYCGFVGWNSPVLDESRFPTEDLWSLLISLNYKKHYLHTNTITYRRSALCSIGGFDESFARHQDLELNLRFLSEYRLACAKFLGAKLKVNPENVDNRKINIDFLKTKQKFLDKFRSDILRLELAQQTSIFKAHADEVIRLCSKDALIAGKDDLPVCFMNILLSSFLRQ